MANTTLASKGANNMGNLKSAADNMLKGADTTGDLSSAPKDAPKVPEYELTSYDPVDIEVKQHTLSNEDLEEALQEQIASMSLDLVESNRDEVNAKDILKLNLEISQDGEVLKNLSSDDRLYMMGDNFMPIGFERGLFGMKVGQLKEFDFDGTIGTPDVPGASNTQIMPNIVGSDSDAAGAANGSDVANTAGVATNGVATASVTDIANTAGTADAATQAKGELDYGVSAAKNSQNFHVKVEVLAIMEHARPKITDEWVAKNMPFYKSADEFRQKTREEIEKQMRNISENEAWYSSVQKLSERFNGTIDDYFYETTRDELLKGYEAQARAQGLDLQDYLGMQGLDEKQFNMMLMMEVRDTLVQGYCLDAWARHYHIEPTEKDINDLADMMSGGNAKEFLEEQKKQDPDLESMKIAAKRFAANKDLVKRSLKASNKLS